jgi:hypothetical protein
MRKIWKSHQSDWPMYSVWPLKPIPSHGQFWLSTRGWIGSRGHIHRYTMSPMIGDGIDLFFPCQNNYQTRILFVKVWCDGGNESPKPRKSRSRREPHLLIYTSSWNIWKEQSRWRFQKQSQEWDIAELIVVDMHEDAMGNLGRWL